MFAASIEIIWVDGDGETNFLRRLLPQVAVRPVKRIHKYLNIDGWARWEGVHQSLHRSLPSTPPPQMRRI